MKTIVYKEEALMQMLRHSLRDFHVKGFDYICLQAGGEGDPTQGSTRAYFFEDTVASAPEVVAPHNHRYDFETTVLAGEVRNFRYRETDPLDPLGRVYDRFAWQTPLNGGQGFRYLRNQSLRTISAERYHQGQSHSHQAEEIHTIQVMPGTVLLLRAEADRLGPREATATWFPQGARMSNGNPRDQGMYREGDLDWLLRRLLTLHALMEPDVSEVVVR